MADATPGTPEYQDAYDAEMKRLEEAGDTPITSEESTNTEAAPAVEVEEETPQPSVEERIAQLQESNERLAQQQKDTKAWATRASQEAAQLRREREEEKHQRARPALLDDVPGLEDAIRHTARPATAKPEQHWGDTVAKALPDIEEHLANPEFFKKAEEVRARLGQDWNDPLIAIRELSNARADYLGEQRAFKAVEQARRDHVAKAKKLGAMAVPGGSGKQGAAKTEQEEAERIRTMSNEEFEKMKRKAKGY
jgi:hypothetical protein